MKKATAQIVAQVDEVTTLLDSAAFAATFRAKDPGGLLINNSFIERTGIRTNKSPYYLYVPIEPGTPSVLNLNAPGVLRPQRSVNVNQVFASDLSSHIDLANAVKTQQQELGKLVLILIGLLDKSLTAEAHVASTPIKTLRYDPTVLQPYLVDMSAKIVLINELGDLGGLQHAVIKSIAGKVPEGLNDALAAALKEVEEKAVVKVLRPAKSTATLARSLLGELATSLASERREYTKALAEYKKNSKAQQHNEVLRIAYNFAGDAIKIIHLLVCVADLKPIILWQSMASHLRLARSFQALPWQSDVRKPSLENYNNVIANARNRAFHNLFAFNRTLDVDVTRLTLKALELKLFRPYEGRKATAALKYEDQELVDVLSSFSRAPERTLDESFLVANGKVMEATEQLAADTAAALLRLAK